MSKKQSTGETSTRRQFLESTGTLGISLAGLSAVSRRTAASDGHPQGGKTIELTPAAGHAGKAKSVFIESVVLTQLADGGIKQSISAEAAAPVEYSVRTNLQEKTYEIREFTLGDGKLNVVNPDVAADSTVEPSGTSPMYDLTVQYTTHNQYEYKLCRTTHFLEWYYHSNYDATIMNDRTVTPRTWSERNWYTETTKFTDLSEFSGKCYSEAFGKHYNDKYGDDHKRTVSEHSIGITGYSNGTSDYTTDAYHYGEGSSYLHTHTVVS